MTDTGELNSSDPARDAGTPAPVWKRLRFEAELVAASEPTLSSYINAAILAHETLCAALSYHLAEKLAGPGMGAQQVRHILNAAYRDEASLLSAAEADMQAVVERDPACQGMLQPFLFFKGFMALQTHRIAHVLWHQGRDTLSFHFQSRSSELFGVDIHPAARIGTGVMLDHATGITIGETAVVGDDTRDDASLLGAAEADMQAVVERDPACQGMLQPFLFFKGFMALQTHRIAHVLWHQGRDTLSFHFQSRSSELFGVDIHPAARIGTGVMLDHATGITIGETAVVGDDCSLLHGVTLGGTGKNHGDRHPKIGRGVLLSVGAKILGNITVGDEAKVAAGSVVLKDVPAHCTVAGVPAKPVGDCCAEPAKSMIQTLPEGAGD